MPWTPVGAPVVGAGNNPIVTVSPATVGNIVVVAVTATWGLYSAGVVPSGGGVAAWKQMSPTFGGGDPLTQGVGSVPNGGLLQPGGLAAGTFLFWGVVSTTGAQAFETGASGNSSFVYQEFIPPIGAIVQDSTYNAIDANASGAAVSSGAWPSVVVGGGDELFIGSMQMYVNSGVPVFSGATAGITYTEHSGAVLVYKCSVTSPTSYAPAWTISGGTVFAPMFSGFLHVRGNSLVMMPGH